VAIALALILLDLFTGGSTGVVAALLFAYQTQRPVVTEPVGRSGHVVAGFLEQPSDSLRGKVKVAGELWNARALQGAALHVGAPIVVEALDGLELVVRAA
jgi:membrane protein implicated in regulation of membrane protease activity